MASTNLVAQMIKGDDYDNIYKLLEIAIKYDDEELVNTIVNSSASIKKRIAMTNTMWKASLFYPMYLTPKILNVLIKNGLPINKKDAYGERLIGELDILKNVDLVKMLLEHGADVNYTLKKRLSGAKLVLPPLEKALCRNLYESAKLLLEYGANINHQYTFDEKQPPLCYRVLYRDWYPIDWKLVKFMLDYGADLSDSDKLRECYKVNRSIIKKIEEFYREPKKRAKPGEP